MSGSRCRFAYGPADGAATHYLFDLDWGNWLSHIHQRKSNELLYTFNFHLSQYLCALL